MSDYIEFGLHDLPWAPAHSELEYTLRYFDGPQAGVINQHGCRYVFHALMDLPDGTGVWFYAGVDEHEAAELTAEADADRADALLHQLIDERPGVLAVVLNGVVAESGEASGARLEFVSAALRPILVRVRDSRDAYNRLDAEALVAR